MSSSTTALASLPCRAQSERNRRQTCASRVMVVRCRCSAIDGPPVMVSGSEAIIDMNIYASLYRYQRIFMLCADLFCSQLRGGWTGEYTGFPIGTAASYTDIGM